MTAGIEEGLLFVLVACGGRRLALPARDVVLVHPMVLVGELPEAPSIVEGVVEVHGQVVPVLDLGQRFGQPPRATRLEDMLVIVEVDGRRAALHVDHDVGLASVAPADLRAVELAEAPSTSGVAVLDDGLVAIHDLATFLTSEEIVGLDELLELHRVALR